MTGLSGLRTLIADYEKQSGRRIERIRISPKLPADHLYVGRFNGGPPEVVMGTDALRRLRGIPSALWGIAVVEES